MNGSKLVLLSCVLVHCFIVTSNNWVKLTMNKGDILQWNISQGISFLLYPLLGWIADVYVSRYKMIKLSFVLLMIGSLLMLAGGIERIFEKNFSSDVSTWKMVLSIIIFLISISGIGIYEANAIQFGMQQLLEASSEQLSGFIYWYYWSFQIGPLITYYVSVPIFFYFRDCRVIFDDSHLDEQNIHIFGWVVLFPSLFQVIAALIGVIMMHNANRHFEIHQIQINPLKKLFQVLQYTYKNKRPERRSAFTYWENQIPSRIDLGKQKYGGPFSYEEVEDVKTFFRLFVLIISLFGFFLSGDVRSSNSFLIHNLGCPNLPLFLILILNPDHIQQLIGLFGIPIYQLWLRNRISHYLPNLMTKVGIGLFLCLLQELTNLIIAYAVTPMANRQPMVCGFKGLDTFMHDNSSVVTFCWLANSKIHQNQTCTTFCPGLVSNSHLFYMSLLQQVIKGLSLLLVNLTVIEFICAQAPLSVKGLLIGIWYSLQSIQYLGIDIINDYWITTGNTNQWSIYSGVKGFAILNSLVLYALVSKYIYRYRERNEVINEQGIIEEQYERELLFEYKHQTNNNYTA